MDGSRERLTVARLVDEARHEFLSIEHGFWFTAKELLLRPGLTMAAVWRGEHKRYTGPFRFFMLSFTLYALVWISTGAMALFWEAHSTQVVASSPSPQASKAMAGMGAIYLAHPLVSEFGTVLAMWLATWIWFRQPLNAAERAALPLYWYGFINLVQVPLFWIAFTGRLIPYTQALSAASLVFIAWGAYTALEPRRWWNALRGVAWWFTGALLWSVALGLSAGIIAGIRGG